MLYVFILKGLPVSTVHVASQYDFSAQVESQQFCGRSKQCIIQATDALPLGCFC